MTFRVCSPHPRTLSPARFRVSPALWIVACATIANFGITSHRASPPLLFPLPDQPCAFLFLLLLFLSPRYLILFSRYLPFICVAPNFSSSGRREPPRLDLQRAARRVRRPRLRLRLGMRWAINKGRSTTTTTTTTTPRRTTTPGTVVVRGVFVIWGADYRFT